MAEDTKYTGEELNELKTIITGIREKAEKFGTQSAEFKRYSENADAKLAELDKKNNDIVANLEKSRIEEAELKDRIAHLEKIGVKANGSDNSKEQIRKDAHNIINAMAKKQWLSFCGENPLVVESFLNEVKHSNIDGLPDLPLEVKNFKNIVMQTKANPDIVRTDISEFGGYLVPMEWSNELFRQIIEYSPIRKYARVKQISGKTLMQPIRQGVPTALWAGETESGSASISNYVLEELTPYRLNNTIPVSWDMLNDSKYNISEEIMTDSALAFAQAEGVACVNGNAVKKPFGFTKDPNVPIYTTAVADGLDFSDMINITGQMKQGYNPMFAFNRRTLAYLRLQKDLNDRFLWSGPFGDAGSPPTATINGYRYSSEFIDMDDVQSAGVGVTGNIPVVFADFFRFYQITDRTDLVLIRDEYTRKKEAIVEFTLMKWTTGSPVVKEAGILMKIK
jgi:HK97 family phage major capsid protein